MQIFQLNTNLSIIKFFKTSNSLDYSLKRLKILQLGEISWNVRAQLMGTSKLNFHIWNANSQSFVWAKSEAKMAAHEENFGFQFQSFV